MSTSIFSGWQFDEQTGACLSVPPREAFVTAEQSRTWFFCSVGLVTDSGITRQPDGSADRGFYGFPSLADRAAFQERIWAESQHAQNAVDCPRQTVMDFKGRAYLIDRETGSIISEMEYQRLADEARDMAN